LPASGALRSTANDLLNFVEAYLGYRETNLDHAMTAQLAYRRPVNGAISQALGWAVMQVGAEQIVMHDGGKAGYRSFVAFNPRTRTGVVVLSNTRSRGRHESLALHVPTGRPLRDSPQPLARTAVPVSDAELEACAGEFHLESGEILDVVRNGSRLLVQFRGSGVGEFFAQGPRMFFSKADDVQFDFKNEHDRILGPIVREGSRETVAVRVH
jgi:CubicO group peptidase (beta-lactamase class C family)